MEPISIRELVLVVLVCGLAVTLVSSKMKTQKPTKQSVKKVALQALSILQNLKPKTPKSTASYHATGKSLSETEIPFLEEDKNGNKTEFYLSQKDPFKKIRAHKTDRAKNAILAKMPKRKSKN